MLVSDDEKSAITSLIDHFHPINKSLQAPTIAPSWKAFPLGNSDLPCEEVVPLT